MFMRLTPLAMAALVLVLAAVVTQRSSIQHS
jgi:hypothetical protein